MSDNSLNIFEPVVDTAKRLPLRRIPENFFQRMLMKLGVLNKYRFVDVFPITYGARLKCSSLLKEIDLDKIDLKKDIYEADELISSEYGNKIKLALAYLIHNDPSTPPDWLLKGIDLMRLDELHKLILFFRESLQIEDFLFSIICMKGMSLQATEIIAVEKENPGNTK